MKYDFSTVTDRKGKDAICVDALGKEGVPGAPKDGFSVIPMWVADMNFPCAPPVVEHMRKRLDHPLFGYFSPSDEFFSSIVTWQEVRHGVTWLTKDCIGYENGVLGGVVSAANILCSRGDHILVHSPTYIGFTHALENNGYKLIHSPLYLDDQNIWRMDYDDMEKRIVAEKIHCAVLCSPHNPCGRVWEKEELTRAMALFQKHDVGVISDEIWSDIITNGYTHIPTQSIGTDARERTIALYAPSKTFSLAGRKTFSRRALHSYQPGTPESITGRGAVTYGTLCFYLTGRSCSKICVLSINRKERGKRNVFCNRIWI